MATDTLIARIAFDAGGVIVWSGALSWLLLVHRVNQKLPPGERYWHAYFYWSFAKQREFRDKYTEMYPRGRLFRLAFWQLVLGFALLCSSSYFLGLWDHASRTTTAAPLPTGGASPQLSTRYRTVFEATNTGMALWPDALLLALSVCAIVAGITILRRAGTRPAFLIVFLLLCGLYGAVTFGSGLRAEYLDQRSIREALKRGDYSVAEGVVTDFVPMPPGGHSIESFNVGGKHFEYYAGWGSVTFNSEYNKGFIYSGVKARITYRDGRILKVEVQ